MGSKAKRSRWVGLFGASFVWVCSQAGCAPSDEIAAASKTAECRADVVKALDAFSSELGLDFNADDSDAQKIFDSGRVAKSYGRDGVRYTVHFGLEKSSGGCKLKFYKRSKSEPGQSSSTTGNYGTVVMTACQCK